MSTSPQQIDVVDAPFDASSQIQIRGARVNNLKNVSLDIPRNQLVVLTGPSGSGKSSLAFDTLFAEGQRQFIESLSVYARQFLHQMERPDVDLIEGLQPTLCINQRPANQNPRSTVATVTEIYDYLRLMMARLGVPHCPDCGEPIQQQTVEQIQERLAELPDGTKTMVMAPLVRGRRGQHKEVFAQIRKAGLLRARVDGEVYEVENAPQLEPRRVHHIDAVVDRIIMKPGIDARLAESIRLAVRLGDGLMSICYHLDGTAADDWRDELYSTIYACPTCNVSYEEIEPRTFSFNSPYGACPDCDGLGVREEFDPELVLPNLEGSLAAGAVLPWKGQTPAATKKVRTELDRFLTAHKATWDTPLSDLPEETITALLHGRKKPKFLGVLLMLEKEFATATRKKRQDQLATFRGEVTCRECDGSRLRREAGNVTLQEKSISEITGLSVGKAHDFFSQLKFPKRDQPIANPLLVEIRHRLEFLIKVGVDYLTLDRAADTLSGGELQRVRLATSIGSGLVGVCYVLDEPSIGLHQRDNQRLIDALRDLQQQGNTVLVVEHDEAMMRQADRLVDVGPGAGTRGGQIIAQGTPEQVCIDELSVTGRYLSGRSKIEVPSKRRRAAKSRSVTIEGATINNLKDAGAAFPLGCFICVTGVSGSGKSSLVNETLARALVRRLGGMAPKSGPFTSLRGVSQIDKVIQIDQSPIGRTPRSNAATYTGLFDEVRKVFANTRDAKQRGFRASRFSFNAKSGRCEECQGHGVKKIEMNFLPDLFVTCNECAGARFNRQTLQVRYKGKTIADVLNMPVSDAVAFFENFAGIHRVLRCLNDVGLGYLPLGQPSTTLSGGEAQRVKLASQLARVDTGQTLYLLDEPTTGLHFEDICRLLEVLGRLVDKGNTVIVIEHNLDVIKCADWLIDLGPEGGEAGGEIVAVGTPEEVAAAEGSFTGQFLKPLLNGHA
ncbi:MAG: ABC-ATPase UvrA [Planctomycetaceae bacterium]|nr:ABC-ATPase UvrA [Planctomycetaceae bacterium]